MQIFRSRCGNHSCSGRSESSTIKGMILGGSAPPSRKNCISSSMFLEFWQALRDQMTTRYLEACTSSRSWLPSSPGFMLSLSRKIGLSLGDSSLYCLAVFVGRQ